MAIDVTDVRRQLEEHRDELTAQLDRITEIPRDPGATISFGKRLGDGTNEAIERLNLIGTATTLRDTLADVERCLVKLDEGTYGLCDRCGDAIPDGRLEARPWSARCVACSSH